MALFRQAINTCGRRVQRPWRVVQLVAKSPKRSPWKRPWLPRPARQRPRRCRSALSGGLRSTQKVRLRLGVVRDSPKVLEQLPLELQRSFKLMRELERPRWGACVLPADGAYPQTRSAPYGSNTALDVLEARRPRLRRRPVQRRNTSRKRVWIPTVFRRRPALRALSLIHI